MLTPAIGDSGQVMKEQYVGDISDYRKYALLRALGGEPLGLGVVWMLTPPDGSSDGRRLSYLDSPAEALYDPELHQFLKSISSSDASRRLRLVQSAGILPNTTFFDGIVPDPLQDRRRYFMDASAAVRDCDLVFFDPDNGLDVPSRPIGSKNSSKYVYRSELAATYRRGQSLLVYQHFPRLERAGYAIALASELGKLCPGSSVWSFATAHVLFLLAAHPNHQDTLAGRAEQNGSRWPASFMSMIAYR